MNLLQLTMSGNVVSIGLNIYLVLVLFILRLIWAVVVSRGGGSRGGHY